MFCKRHKTLERGLVYVKWHSDKDAEGQLLDDSTTCMLASFPSFLAVPTLLVDCPRSPETLGSSYAHPCIPLNSAKFPWIANNQATKSPRSQNQRNETRMVKTRGAQARETGAEDKTRKSYVAMEEGEDIEEGG